MVDTEIDEDSLTEEVYLANAAHFREKLESVVSATEVSEHLASNEDARTTYNGYNKVLTDDLAHSSKSNKEEITAKKMILRGKVCSRVPLVFELADLIGLCRCHREHLSRVCPSIDPSEL